MESEQPAVYEIGQVVNGHVWNGSSWEPMDGATATASAPNKPWFKRWWGISLIAVGVLTLFGMVSGGGESETAAKSKSTAGASTGASAVDSSSDSAEEAIEPAEEVKPVKEAPEPSVGQQNALRSAESYLDTSPFSKQGLIDQLSSKYGEGYDKADADWAVNNLSDVNWKEQAYLSGKSYLEMQGFSRMGLIDQLSSSAGEQFTRKQATYAANKLGL